MAQSTAESLGQQIQKAVNDRKEKLNYFKENIDEKYCKYLECQSTTIDADIKSTIESNMNGARELIDNLIDSPMDIVVCGQINAGKSTLVSQLIGVKSLLPSNDEVNTRKLTKVIFSKNIQCDEVEIDPSCKLTSGTYKGKRLPSDYKFPKLTDYKEINTKTIPGKTMAKSIEKQFNKKAGMRSFIKIGHPKAINNVNIIDCPGFGEDKEINEWVFALLPYQLQSNHPSIICYVYDAKKGFSMKDAENLDIIHACLFGHDRNMCHLASFIMIANKVDDSDLGKFDSPCIPVFSEEEEFLEIHHKCDFKKSVIKLERSLPVVPLSATNYHMYEKLFETISTQVAESFSAIVDMAAYCMRGNFQDHQFKQLILNRDWLKFWFEIKSKSINAALKRSYDEIVSNENNLLLNFQHGYKIYGDTSRTDNSIQITKLSEREIGELDFNEEMSRIFVEKIYDRNVLYIENEEDEDKSLCIYIVDKNMPTTRLIDKLDNDSENQAFISQLLQKCFELNKRNFRPDTLFVDSSNNTKLNNNIPNLKQLPFLSKGSKEMAAFHLSPLIESHFLEDWDHVNFQTTMTLGWCIWLLLGGPSDKVRIDLTTEEKLRLLKENRNENYPRYFDDLMIDCWKVTFSPSQKYIQRLRRISGANAWIRKCSSDLNDDLKLALTELSEPFLDYPEGYSLYKTIRNNKLIIVSKLVKPLVLGCETYEEYILSGNDEENMGQQSITDNLQNSTEIPCIDAESRSDENSAINNDGEERKELTRNIYYAKDEGVDFKNEKVRIWHNNKVRKGHNNKNRKLCEIFQSENECSVFIIDRGISANCKRLLDVLHEISWKDRKQIIKNFAVNNEYFNPNFRPDTLFIDFIDSNLQVHQIHGIPNHPSLPLLLKDRMPVDPFYLHPDIQNIRVSSIVFENWLESLNGTQNVYGFGWFVWIVCEGSGEKCPSEWGEVVTDELIQKWISEASSQNLPKCLVDVMKLCWSVKTGKAGNNIWLSTWNKVHSILKRSEKTSKKRSKKV